LKLQLKNIKADNIQPTFKILCVIYPIFIQVYYQDLVKGTVKDLSKTNLLGTHFCV